MISQIARICILRSTDHWRITGGLNRALDARSWAARLFCVHTNHTHADTSPTLHVAQASRSLPCDRRQLSVIRVWAAGRQATGNVRNCERQVHQAVAHGSTVACHDPRAKMDLGISGTTHSCLTEVVQPSCMRQVRPRSVVEEAGAGADRGGKGLLPLGRRQSRLELHHGRQHRPLWHVVT